jgi:penicillin-insensitive murein endopeptidase
VEHRRVFARSPGSILRRLVPLACLLLCALGGLAASAPALARAKGSGEADASGLPAKFRKAPFNKMSLSVGSPNHGSQVRAKRLKKAPYLKVRDSSRERSYGHPSLVLMLDRSAKQVAKARPGSVLLVGDLSTERGGALSGHHSHQSGRDADLAFYARDTKGKAVVLDRFVAFDGEGKAKDGSGLVFDDDRNWLFVMSLARDARADLAYVFISNPLRARLLAHANKRPEYKKYVPLVTGHFMQPENAEPHDDHFHVRIRCPKDQEGLCREAAR